MSDAPSRPDLTVVLELKTPLSKAIIELASEYHETPQQTVHRLLWAGIMGREALAAVAQIIDLLGGDPPDDDSEGR
jgi:hypothetical protein